MSCLLQVSEVSDAALEVCETTLGFKLDGLGVEGVVFFALLEPDGIEGVEGHVDDVEGHVDGRKTEALEVT